MCKHVSTVNYRLNNLVNISTAGFLHLFYQILIQLSQTDISFQSLKFQVSYSIHTFKNFMTGSSVMGDTVQEQVKVMISNPGRSILKERSGPS